MEGAEKARLRMDQNKPEILPTPPPAKKGKEAPGKHETLQVATKQHPFN